MVIKTNLSWNTLAKYSALLWNNGKDDYIATGDNLVEMIEDEDDPDFILTVDYLRSDCEWHIQGYYDMLEEDFIAVCHQDFKEGRRDAETIKGHEEYLKQRKVLNAFKRNFKKWLEEVEEVPVWTYDTDTTDFIIYDYTNGAKPILH